MGQGYLREKWELLSAAQRDTEPSVTANFPLRFSVTQTRLKSNLGLPRLDQYDGYWHAGHSPTESYHDDQGDGAHNTWGETTTAGFVRCC